MNLDEFFTESGPLGAVIPKYRPRAQQLEMAARIFSTLETRGRLVAEAGTGTGKTLAYLIPALLFGGKVIVSTGTKTLQDQLFHRDIPAVREALARPVTIALLKGRGNYVCPYHLERALTEARLKSRDEALHLRAIARFAAVSDSGDRMACNDVPENSPAWAFATSTRDNCLGGECPSHKDCFVLKARKKALEADVVVVNHHLFFADVWLKDEGAGELLPASNAVIFDEAHQLPATASLFFGETVTTGVIIDLCRDVKVESAVAAADFAELPVAAGELETAARDVRLALGLAQARLPAARALEREEFREAVEVMVFRLARLDALLESQAERAEALAQCHARCREAANRLEKWRTPDAEVGMVRWLEAATHSVLFHATPLNAGELFARQIENDSRAWIFTSATLSVRGNFSHYLHEIGLLEADTGVWDSPFDYATQALLYVPEKMPDPNSPEYGEAALSAAWPLVKASGGRAFLLFTSLRAMNAAHKMIQARMSAGGVAYPLLLQGEKSRSELLDEFRRLGNAVLLGSQSFWEGVDVAGEALSLVVIDRLPFQPPDDPVLAARMEVLRQAGKNPFFDHQLPHAVISLKQGAGRLIRRESDHGVLMICDPRLVDKPYGRRIWQALPPMKRTRKEAEAVDFLRGHGAV
ncbi:MAG: ATP-dependent DNA helicase [Pseudomonadota bacterium]|nr:ATP-dependent DNA helicase [Pseudomonadota bacterium]MDP1904097.1 ATP-dependent DNA helicase [Pseudomonadota bacterium]MDP2354212.1 ATP-dependent DNA helicase [Pseudomonadota bacterium]